MSAIYDVEGATAQRLSPLHRWKGNGHVMIRIDANVRAELKANGFQWVKNGSTDRVEAKDIKDILPAAGGFTVVYDTENTQVIIKMTTARVEKIELAPSRDQWNRVHWISTVDEYKDGTIR